MTSTQLFHNVHFSSLEVISYLPPEDVDGYPFILLVVLERKILVRKADIGVKAAAEPPVRPNGDDEDLFDLFARGKKRMSVFRHVFNNPTRQLFHLHA